MWSSHLPAPQIPSMTSCVFSVQFCSSSTTQSVLHFIPAFPSCVLSFSNNKTLSLSPRCSDMKFTSILSFTFSRKLCYLGSSVLLGQGVPQQTLSEPRVLLQG